MQARRNYVCIVLIMLSGDT